MKRVVAVSGASGFVGRHVCRVLTARGHSVVGLGRGPLSAYEGLDAIVADWVVWDMAEKGGLRLPNGVTAVVHMAQSPRYREFPDGASDMFNVNLRSTFDFLEAARKGGVKRFVYVSSGGVYGENRSEPPEAPILAKPQLGFYQMTKFASEQLAKTYEKLYSIAILRPFFPIGPGQQPERMMRRLIESVMAGRSLKLQGEEGIIINPIFVADAAEVIARAVEHESALTVDVAGRESVSLRRLGEMIGASVGRKPVFEVDASQKAPTLLGDCDGMVRHLGYTPAVDLADAIAWTIAGIQPGKPA